MDIRLRRLLVEGSKRFGVSVDRKLCEDFGLFMEELLRWNRKFNLTAIRTEKGIVLRHFLDSLSLFPFLERDCAIRCCRLLDMGSGAGFPGIPLKMVLPRLDVTLIDSTLKKVDFQRYIIRTLRLKGIEAVHGRVEAKEMVIRFAASFDFVVSRAFSDLNTFLELSHPYLKSGGQLFAMRGQVQSDEIEAISKDRRDKYRFKESTSFILPFSDIRRGVLIFEKL